MYETVVCLDIMKLICKNKLWILFFFYSSKSIKLGIQCFQLVGIFVLHLVYISILKSFHANDLHMIRSFFYVTIKIILLPKYVQLGIWPVVLLNNSKIKRTQSVQKNSNSYSYSNFLLNIFFDFGIVCLTKICCKIFA